MSDGVNSPNAPRWGFRIRAPQDFWGGLALIALAVFALWASRDLPGMHGFAFGPGTAPRLFAGVLCFFGAIIALIGVTTDGPPIGGYAVRGPILITAALLTFAAMVRPIGLVPATFITFMISAAASKETRWIESTIMAVFMTVFCVVLFVYLLNLPFQLWPRF
jgi:putative tricarboxylic transport membrane protein